MELPKFIISIIIFAVVIVTGVAMIGDVNNSYNISIGDESKFSDIYNQSEQIINNTYDTGQAQGEDLFGANISGDATEESMFLGAFSAIRLVTDHFELVGDVIRATAEAVGVPTYFITITLVIINILVLFAMVYLVFRFRP